MATTPEFWISLQAAHDLVHPGHTSDELDKLLPRAKDLLDRSSWPVGGLVFATLVSAVLVSFESCSACSTSGRNVELCVVHAAEEIAVEEELAAFEREGGRLATKDPAGYVVVLDKLAALTEGHTNAPSERVVRLIAAGLEHESFEVRTHVAGLLGRPQHAQASLKALVTALAKIKPELATLQTKIDALIKKWLKSDQGNLDEAKACAARRTALTHWRHALIERISTFPDNEAVDAILAHTDRNLLTGDEGALVRLGNRKAMRSLIDSFLACDRDMAEVAENAERLYPRAQTTLRQALALHLVEDKQTAFSKARAELETLLAERGMTPPHAFANTADWIKWIEENIQAFPERLPGLSSPAW